MLPAAGQGILAVQTRRDAPAWLESLNDPDARDCALAERAFVRVLDGGCSSPVAAYAVIEGEELLLTGMDETGRRQTIRGSRQEAEALGSRLGARIKEEKCHG